MASILCVLLLLGNVFVFGYGACPSIISREDWSQVPPAPNPEKLAVPVDNVIVHQRVSHFYTKKKNSCKKAVHEIQNKDKLLLRQSDISHNFLVCQDGEVYEGRGWDEAAPHWHGYYGKSIGIAIIDNSTGRAPTPEALHALQQLIECGVEKGKIKSTHSVLGYRYSGQIRNKFFDGIHKWKNWTPWAYHF